MVYENRQQVFSVDLSLENDKFKILYNDLSDAVQPSRHTSGKQGIQITYVQCMKESFMFVFDLTPDDWPSDGHTSLPDSSSNPIELKFDESLFQAVTILL